MGKYNSTMDISMLERKIARLKVNIADSTEILAEDIAKMGRSRMRYDVTTSRTPWGDFRKSEGRPYAGRREEDTMWKAITYRVTSKVAEWGWLGERKKYYKYQEFGTGRIKAMNSLRESRQYVMDRLPKLIKDFESRIKR